MWPDPEPGTLGRRPDAADPGFASTGQPLATVLPSRDEGSNSPGPARISHSRGSGSYDLESHGTGPRRRRLPAPSRAPQAAFRFRTPAKRKPASWPPAAIRWWLAAPIHRAWAI